MIENFLTAFIVYFVVIDPIGTAPIFLAVTAAQDKRAKIGTAIEATLVATLIMVFFALCGSWVLRYLQIGEPAFKIAGGVILFLVAWDMLTSKRQARKHRETTSPATGPTPALAPEAGTAEAGAEPPRQTANKRHQAATMMNRKMWQSSHSPSRCWPDRRRSCR